MALAQIFRTHLIATPCYTVADSDALGAERFNGLLVGRLSC